MIVVIGNTTVDFFISGLPRLPDPGGDEFTVGNLIFYDQPQTIVLGGNAANCAYALSRLGAPVGIGSAIGRDQAGRLVLDWLAATDIDRRGLIQDDHGSTATTTVITDQALNRLAFHNPGATVSLAPADLPPGLLTEAEIVLLSSYPLLTAWRSAERTAAALNTVRQAGARTALDIGPAIGQPAVLAELRSALPAVDYLICNVHELAVFTGSEDLSTGITAVLQAGAGCVIIKRGDQGALLQPVGATMPIDVPGFAVEARFTVGAGDAFNAGLLYGFQTGRSLPEAGRLANAVAALVVASGQGILGAPDLAQVETFIKAQS